MPLRYEATHNEKKGDFISSLCIANPCHCGLPRSALSSTLKSSNLASLYFCGDKSPIVMRVNCKIKREGRSPLPLSIR